MGKEKKERRRHIFKHKPYLEAAADRILTTSPTREIIYNTQKDIYETGWSEGYLTRIDDSKFFKDKREEHRKNSFGMVKNHIDDIIHEKIKRQSNNQPKK